MFISSISNSRLHCCFIILILFILIFLSLPLLLVYLANNKANNQAASSETSLRNSRVEQTNLNQSTNEQLEQVTRSNSLTSKNQCNPVEDENFHCPKGTFACKSCPSICVVQGGICDGIIDCPDESDEVGCRDNTGVFGSMMRNIYNHLSQQSDLEDLNENLNKPDSCPVEQFKINQCPCVLSESKVVFCERSQLTKVPNTLLSSVTKINMSNNSITSIDEVMWPRSLSALVIVNNQITHISNSTFEQTPNLSMLWMNNNSISHIDIEAFKGLTSLSKLELDHNRLETFESRLLDYSPRITKLSLTNNLIDLPHRTRFSHCRYLIDISLQYNKISIIKENYFSNMTALRWLSLEFNEISHIEPNSFDWDYELEELNLSFNKIKTIDSRMFATKLNIQRLHLAGNKLEPLPVDAFSEILQLQSLNLTDIDFDYIRSRTFTYLINLDYIYFKNFHYCYYAYHVRVCKPITNGVSSTKNLLAFPILRYAVWIVALACSLGNVFVFIWRTISTHEDHTLSLFVRNLSIADLLMGLYLIIIAYYDSHFQDEFGKNAIEWMSSSTCTALGFLAILSSELSVFIITIITIERYRSVMSIEYEPNEQKPGAFLYIALAWFLSFLIAFYPLLEWFTRSSEDFYATNGLCLPLHIDQPFTPGWRYSAFIYLGINFIAVLVIICLYAHMYNMIMSNRKSSRPVVFKAEKREDAILALRFFFIVVTDCLCWIPIVVIKVVALANVPISSSIYGWLVVFIIPINSALNPIVYTLSAPTSLRAAVFRLCERICYRLDLLTNSLANYWSRSKSSSKCAHSYTSPVQDSDSPASVVVCHNEKRRKKTGSNSTTCDTFDTSVSSSSNHQIHHHYRHSKTSSTPLMNNALVCLIIRR